MVHPPDSEITKYTNLPMSFSEPSARLWHNLGLTGALSRAWQTQDMPTPVAVKGALVLCIGQTQYTSTLLGVMLREHQILVRIPFQLTFISFVQRFVLDWLGSGQWLVKESSMHINLEMKAIFMAFTMFQQRIMVRHSY